LIDFGIAAPVTRENDATRSEVFGSPGHMPPEQLHGAELTPATDVFAVGVLLIEAWSGYPPFRRANARESERALFEVPPPIDRKHAELEPLSALIASSVALDARDRPAGAEALARPLREFLRSYDTGDLAQRLGARVRRARRRSQASNPWLVGEGALPKSSPSTRPMHGETPVDRTPALREPGTGAVTRTFAASDNLEEWTRKISSAPQPEDGAPSGISSSKASRAPAPGAGLGLLAALGVGALAIAISIAKPRTVPTPPKVIQATAAAVPAPEPPLPLTPSPASASPAPSVPSAKPMGRKLAPLASSEPQQLGMLRLTADPGATVEISGARFHRAVRTPIAALEVPAGKYALVFRNDTFGAALSAQALVLAGATRSVHADFRQAEPTVVVR
jgi:serine/threonine-protein kinase